MLCYGMLWFLIMGFRRPNNVMITSFQMDFIVAQGMIERVPSRLISRPGTNSNHLGDKCLRAGGKRSRFGSGSCIISSDVKKMKGWPRVVTCTPYFTTPKQHISGVCVSPFFIPGFARHFSYILALNMLRITNYHSEQRTTGCLLNQKSD